MKYLAAFTKSIAVLGLVGAMIIAPAIATAAEVGQSYYTQYNLWVENEVHKTTNYSRGELIPVNTRVTVESMGGKNLFLDMDGRLIEVRNIPKHTQRDIKVIADELLGKSKAPVSSVKREFQGDLEAGILRLGMTKEQVIMARGYPPRHKTASTKANIWVYWSSRFVQRTLVFRDNKLVEGRGLY